MAITLTRNLSLGRCDRLSKVCCCAVLLLLTVVAFRVDGAEATNSTGAGGSGSSGDQTPVSRDDGGKEEESTVERGMRPFFDMVHGFLGVVQPKRLYDQSWMNLSQLVKDGKIQDEQLSDWENWVLYLVGFVVCLAVGVLFFIVVPITGLIFCCCRCSGRCGGKSKPQDPKHAGCKRTTYCTLLLIVNTVALAGVVCMFLSNQILYNKMQNLDNEGPTGKIIHAANTLNQFFNDTVNEVEDVILDPFLQAKDDILKDITDSAASAVDAVLETLNANTLLDQTKDLADEVNKMKQELTNAGDQLTFLSAQGQLLAANLSALQGEVLAVCPTSSDCPGVDTAKFNTSADFSSLDKLTTELTKVEAADNLNTSISQAEDTIKDAKENATNTVETGVTGAESSVDTMEQDIRKAVDDVKTDIQGNVTEEVDKFSKSVSDAQDDITKYSEYVWYAGLGIACVLLLIVVLYYVGILFGLCGERPGYDAQCCNTGTGANFLLAGVGFTFLLSWLIMLACLVTFAVGGVVYTEVCRYFDNHVPQDLKPYSDAVMELVNLQEILYKGQDVELSVVTILEDCENDTALYKALKLEYVVNITEKLDLTQIETALNDLESNSFKIPKVDILTTDMNDSLREFANSGVDAIPFDAYYAEVNKSLTKENLTTLASQLRTVAANLLQTRAPDADKLNSVADQLDQLKADIVDPMQEAENKLVTSLDYLQASTGIKNSTLALQAGLQQAEDNFNTQKDALVRDEVMKLTTSVLDTVQTLINTALYEVHNNVGKCHPIFESFYAASDSVCVAALEPLNGMWFSMGWCLFFFMPALIFSVKLAGLYRREHEERDFDDPNFPLYSEGGKRDSIPLSSRQQHQQPRGRGSSAGAGDERRPRGVSNSAYQADTHLGPSDYPNYKGGGAVNSAYQDDGYHRPAPTSPPPYGAQSYSYGHHHGAMNGNPKSRNDRYPY